MRHSNHRPFNQPHTVQGSTLVEVMVSVFLLTFGVLGLMAAQIRSVAAISEAENRSIVAQAAENLSDAMQINPSVQQLSNDSIVRRYPNYLTPRVVSLTPNPSVALPNPSWGNWNNGSVSGITKDNLARQHLAFFNYSLNQLPNATNVQYAICLDRSTPAEPTINAAGTMTPNCRGSNAVGDKTVIKIVWTIRSENKKSPPPVYTYQMAVPH